MMRRENGFGFLRKALTQYRKVESSFALLRLFDNHDNLLNKKSHLTRALTMYCRLSDWFGIPTPNVRSKIQPYFMRKRFHGNKKHKQ